jgi:tetratricopeptide (TPR) repeat protein
MKKVLSLFILVMLAAPGFSQPIATPPSGGNQKSRVSQWIGPVEVTITYNSPDVTAPDGRSRKGHIWGELVHYGYIDQNFGTSKAAPWRAGANENTTISFSHDVKIQGKDLKAGTYGVFLVTAKEGPWTWIFSKNSGSWGSYFYSDKEDALRVETNPQDAPYTEWLTFGFDDRQLTTATAYLQWDEKRVPFKIEVSNVYDIYLATIRDQLRNFTGFDARNYSNAAQFCAANKINLEEALAWADKAMDPTLGGVEDFNSLQVKSQVLLAMNREADANVAMDKAIKHSSATVQGIHQYGRSLLASGKKEKAMEVFQYNFKAHPEDKFTPYVGLARGYTAMGDTKNAIKNWELAIKNLPENQKANVTFYEGELKKLREAK